MAFLKFSALALLALRAVSVFAAAEVRMLPRLLYKLACFRMLSKPFSFLILTFPPLARGCDRLTWRRSSRAKG